MQSYDSKMQIKLVIKKEATVPNLSTLLEVNGQAKAQSAVGHSHRLHSQRDIGAYIKVLQMRKYYGIHYLYHIAQRGEKYRQVQPFFVLVL